MPWQTIIQPEWSETMPTSQISLDVRKPAAQVAVIDVHGQVTGAAEVPLMNA